MFGISSIYSLLVTVVSVSPVPTFVAKGIRISGTGNATPALPAGLQANDIILLVVETANETVSAPAGYANVANSPQGAGTGGAIGSTGVSVFWKRHSGSETDPTVLDPGDHQNSQTFGFRGCITTGNPWSNTAGGANITQTTAFSASGPTTSLANELAVIIVCCGLDASTAKFTTANNMTGTGLTNLINQEDQSSTSGNGGGIALWTATKATSGTITSLTATANNSTEMSWLIMGLKPA